MMDSPPAASLPTDPAACLQAGISALQAGEAQRARLLFERALAAGVADGAAAQLGLAYACVALKEPAAALAAVERALALEPRHLRALMLRADLAAAADDDRAAAAFYQAALKAVPPEAELPPHLQQELARARTLCAGYAQRFEAHLQQQLAATTAALGPASPRFQQSVELLLGRKQVFVQSPRLYYFPELPQIQFYPREQFPWLDGVEAATAEIRAELQALLQQQPAAFQPYVQGDPNRPSPRRGGMLDNPDWSAFYLWKNGAPVAENAARCPRTLAALAQVPLTSMPGRAPSILFSLLRPGARIPPHTGFLNTRLICHLPLIVPPGCGFRVGNDTREWVEGKAWVFDDTMEHEAWNLSDQTRVILLFEIWRPELTADECARVGAMFEAIDRQGGGGGEWGI